MPKGWFVGEFLPKTFGPRHSRNVEVKWGVHPKGEGKPPPGTSRGLTTLSLLISGCFTLTFTKECRSVTLEKPGDYVIFPHDSQHYWIANEDSVIVSIRWPQG